MTKSLRSYGLLAILMVFLLVTVALALEKRVGTVRGQIALEQPGFGLSSKDIRDNKVYVVAIGPRNNSSPLIERGTWVKPNGTFELAQLPLGDFPMGEYTLSVKAPGFQTHTESGVFVQEGQVTQIHNPIKLNILEPSVNMASNTRVFTTKETPKFWINATGANHATVKIYRKNVRAMLQHPQGAEKFLTFSSDLSVYKPSDKEVPTAEALLGDQPVQTFERKLESQGDDWARAQFKLDAPLPAGDYVASVSVDNLKKQKNWNLMWFTVSDLGLVIKEAPEKTVVRAIDLNTLQPMPNVSIQLLNRESASKITSLSTLKTNAQGFADYPIPAGQRSRTRSLLVAGDAGQNHALGGLDFWDDYSNRFKTYFYTERPVYRLGQTVYFKGITRKFSEAGFSNPHNLPIEVSVQDPDSNILWQGKLTTNEHGTFHGVIDIPKDAKTGGYGVNIRYPDDSSDYETFEVAEYRKPEYQVDVLPTQSRVIAGDQAKVRIRATYYFGAPVANARVKYSIYAASDWSSRYKLMPRPDFYSYYDDWESADYDDGYAGDYITEGYAQTDEAGEAIITFDTKASQPQQEGPYGWDYLDKRYKIQAEVTDLSRMSVIGSSSLPVKAGRFVLFAQPTRSVLKAGESASATITAVDHDGKAVANQKITAKLSRWVYDRNADSYRNVDAGQSITANTSTNGQAVVNFALPQSLPSDDYYLTVQGTDTDGHVISDQTSLWVANVNEPYMQSQEDADSQPLSVKMDKPVYQPGDTANVMITAPLTGKEGAQAIVAIEGRRLFNYQIVPMDATAKLVQIPIGKDYAPNAFVSVTLVGQKHVFLHQSEILKVSPAQQFLNVSVTADKARYKPGDTAKYQVVAKHADGTPAANTEVSLGIVDESIYAIRPETAQDIAKFFYHRQENAVMTVSSFPEEYSGGPDKVEPRVRKDFRDMAAWYPTLLTNAQGIASATVKLPDNLTTWRATVRAVDLQTQVGQAISKVISTQDILVRLAMPRFFTMGDHGLVTAIVHNYSETAQPIQLTMALPNQFKTSLALDQKFQLDPEKAQRVSWPVDVANAGQGNILVKAVGNTEGDALEMPIRVNPLGVAMTDRQTGVLTDDKPTATLAIKHATISGPLQYDLSMASSLIGPALGNFESLIDYPYGCTEQTMSRLVPAAIAMQLHDKLAIPTDQQAKFAEVKRQGLAKLRDYQNADSGWGWWKNDTSNIFLTAYTLDGLKLLNEDINNSQALDWLSKSATALNKQLYDPKIVAEPWQVTDRLIDLAHAQYTLSLYGRKPDAAVTQMFLSRNAQLPVEAMAYLVLAYQKTDNASGFYSMLKRARQSDNSWDQGDNYRYGDVETTALALKAVMAMEPDNKAYMEPSLQWLLAQRGKDGWDNTKTTAQVLQLLMAYQLQNGSAATDATVKVLINDALVQSLPFDAKSVSQPEQHLATVDLSTWLTQQASISLQKTGPGRIYYLSLFRYFLPLKPGETIAQKTLPEGLKIRRAFYRLKPTVVDNNGTVKFQTEPLNGSVRAGETIVMKLLIDSPNALPYLMLESPLPSGGEVVIDDPKSDLMQDESDEDKLDYNLGTWWWTHQDVLDDKMVFFATSMPKGHSEVYTLVRMEMPGQFQMNPVHLTGMYTTAIDAYSPLDQLTVTE